MTDLSYMIRSDWANFGIGIESNNQLVADRFDHKKVIVAVYNLEKFNSGEDDAACDVLEGVADCGLFVQDIVGTDHLMRSVERTNDSSHSILVVHPGGNDQYEAIRRMYDSGITSQVHVMTWYDHDSLRYWLDSQQALNVARGTTSKIADKLRLAATRKMVEHQYNLLSTGRGKDAVIQLLRACRQEGDELDESTWLRAFFEAGGNFREADTISRFVREIKSGKKHQTKPRYKSNILEILKNEILES